MEYILMYFNNEQELFKVTYDSAMNEDLGNWLQIKDQNELIGKDGSFKKMRYRNTHNNNALPSSEDERFVDALTNNESTVSTMPRSKEVFEKYNQLNSEFSNRISVISGKVDTSNKDKAKEKVVDSESEKLNENKKKGLKINLVK
ncbi:hypothetical protein RhiirA4_457608 [Rhizophagus irregularis]|uniref:Uncharacterized protein n=1 Tax=Rhizophagus irregularis TaxID=588596 RepID=A0A2I1GAE3_9GLOM|nr:hypothetical protein RhiirA4_457608 [Rhizophagus irregularis]